MQLPAGIVVWKVKIHTLLNNQWLYVGIIGQSSPAKSSYNDTLSYGWAGHGQVYQGGKCIQGHGGWPSTTAMCVGDVLNMKLDSITQVLSMTHSRLGTFEIILPRQPKWFVHFNLNGQGDSVEILDMAYSRASRFTAFYDR
jgi:hypothetical protein